jgi:hypothetical protein
MRTPPHQCPMKPSDGWKSSSEACQPNSPSRVGKPNIILGFLVVDVVMLVLRWRVFAITDAGIATKERKKQRKGSKTFINLEPTVIKFSGER